MARIDQLSTVDELEDADGFPVFDESNSDARRAPFSVVKQGVKDSIIDPDTAPAIGDRLIFNGSLWVPESTLHGSTHENGGADEISVAGLNGVLADKQDADKLQGRDVAATAPSSNQVLTWNGSAWAPATPASGGTITDTTPHSIVGGYHTSSSAPGDFTTGGRFYCLRPCTIVGARIWWNDATATTLKALLYENGLGVTTADGTLAVSAAGLYDIMFDTPRVVTAADFDDTAKQFTIGVYETSGTRYMTFNSAAWTNPMNGMMGYCYFMQWRMQWYAAGEAIPLSQSAGEHYPIDPIITYTLS